MSSLRSRAQRVATAVVLGALVLVGGAAPAQADYSPIEGSGSTSGQMIVDQWIANLGGDGLPAVYVGSGSSQGRSSFARSETDFGITDIPYQGVDAYGNADTSLGRQFAYVPFVAGGTAFTYHLEQGGMPIRDIRLSGETLARIFTNEITSWADPAIVADNNGRVLLDTAIVPVVRSDGAGTTEQFTAYLDATEPGIWRPYFGQSGATAYYPTKPGTPMITAAGSDQVVNTVASTAGNGMIAYVENAYALTNGLPVVKVLNAAGFFVAPTPGAVAVALTHATFVQDPGSWSDKTAALAGVYSATDPRAYPLSSYSYLLLPTGANDQRMTTDKRLTLVDFVSYGLCDGQNEAGALGYAPLPLNLVQAGYERLAALGAADPAVGLIGRDASTCDNPTFDRTDLARDRLSEIAPAPQACDQQGQDPCLGAGQSMGPSDSRGRLGVELSVPSSAIGSLSLEIQNTAPMHLRGERDTQGNVHAIALLTSVRVIDTRSDAALSLWEVNAQVSPFTGQAGTVGAGYLGMNPSTPAILLEPGSPLRAQAGVTVDSKLRDAASTGLSAPALLGRSTVAGRGSTFLPAGLGLDMPPSVAPGDYTATLTLTLISS